MSRFRGLPLVSISNSQRQPVQHLPLRWIDPADEEWAREHFLPLLKHEDIEFLGEVDEATKAELLAGATALLFPINWPEPSES